MSVMAEGGISATSLRTAVVEAGRRWCRGQYRLVQLVTALDTSAEWALDGAPTCAHWVANALDVEVCTAREWLRVGRALGELDVLDEAFGDGRLSYSKVRALSRVATPETQVELCALAERVPAGHLGCALAAWQQRRETPDETQARQRAARYVSWRIDVDGTVAGWFKLPPADGAFVTTAIDARVRHHSHASADASRVERNEWPSFAQQRADALVALAQGGGTQVVNEVVLHVRGDGCTLDDGTPISESVVERIVPQSFLRALIHDAEKRPINASVRRRHPTQRQQRVVHERDRTCVDCGSSEFLEYDHHPSFEETGHTVVDELELRCAACHHRKHRAAQGPDAGS